MQIDKDRALRILKEEVEASYREPPDEEWARLVKALGEACGGQNLTFIAMLGTALLAKATNLKADPFALKAGLDSPGAYSARALCQYVLAAHAPQLDIDLGVTGREPLNNQPFFAKDRVSRALPVHTSGLAAFEVLLNCLGKISQFRAEAEARAALRAFLYVRRKLQQTVHVGKDDGDHLTPGELLSLICRSTADDSEHGKRAQAIVAGLLDVIYTESRVLVGRVYDPDRHVPGDIGILSENLPTQEVIQVSEYLPTREVIQVYEVRDKPVTDTDLYHAVEKAHRFGVHRVGVISVADSQGEIDAARAREWAWQRGVALLLEFGWQQLLDDVVFRSRGPVALIVGRMYRAILRRMRKLEVSEAGIRLWLSSARPPEGRSP